MHTESGHETQGRTYIIAWVGLLALTAASFGFSGISSGAWGSVLALGIAGVKALVVVVIFMHLLESVFATKMVVLITFLWIALLCLGMVADVAYR